MRISILGEQVQVLINLSGLKESTLAPSILRDLCGCFLGEGCLLRIQRKSGCAILREQNRGNSLEASLRSLHFTALIEKLKFRFLAPLATRRALSALHKAKRHAWFLCDLLEHRLQHGLISPEDVMRALNSWREHAEQYGAPVPTYHTMADVVTTAE